MRYVNYTNIDASFCRPYEPGDRLVKGWEGEAEELLRDAKVLDDTGVLRVLERIYAKHNRDDRPDGRLCPSMSVGDVVIIGEVAYSVANFGFEPVNVDPADLITDRTWSEVIA